jgi:uncharacterized damage-inducible protein DinB
MNPMEGMAQQMNWVARNTAHNLGFIPKEKLTWKPAPTSKSALEIISHTAGFIHAMTPVLTGGEFKPPQFPTLTSLEEAQNLITSCTETYAAALARLTPADLGRTVQLPFGPFPLARAASMPVVDLIHHHGQIAYIQTLLGDTEDHLLMS